jgi:peptidoglycan/xylan/chitin deacetylase (PgdA/CDA1 family)
VSVVGAEGADCPGNPNAIGVSRILTVKPSEYPLVGTVQYQETLRLKDHEVVLTFDDGPSAPYTATILNILASECIKATFFVLGTSVADAPDLLRRAYDEGHNIGTHTFDHENLNELDLEKAKVAVDKGIAAASEALGSRGSLVPFFRPPYLEIAKPAEAYVLSKGLMVWSVDADSEDWTEPDEETFVAKSLADLNKRGNGILLMHDSQPVTARGLRMLIAELKKQNYKIVHVVPDRTEAVSTGQAAKQSAMVKLAR